MRWSNLTLDADEQHRLPGYADAAVVRRFDAPEALDIRFYEVQARSMLNRVPEQSRMPFRWTVNPYRGCTHACAYCLSGDTPILIADGSPRALAMLRPGDRIYGTERRGTYRRFVTTEVLDHWSTVKEAYRVLLEDGTELVASGDHRFLSRRGWKHVTGGEWGELQRPHLTVGTELLGVGGFVAGPAKTAEYRRGYLSGMVRGDGHRFRRAYARTGRCRADHCHLPLALTDREALSRAQDYLLLEEITMAAFAFSPAAETRRAMGAIRTGARSSVERIGEAIEWPEDPSDDWGKGFLAGIFDAEGSCSRGVLRIANTDPELIDSTVACLEHFGFDAVVEDREVPNGLRCVRLRGGLPERLRFFHTVDSAITRKRSIEGQALKTSARLDVVSVEPLGLELPLYDITTGTGDFIANGVVSHNCFARPTHTYLGMDAGRDFEREIVVKVNAPERLRVDLARPSWKREHVALGTNTDPYQWVESRYRLMPGIWEALLRSGTPCSVLTKSPLLLRDVDCFRALAAGPGFTASLSVPTLDEKAWRASEPHTPNPRARLEAVAELNRAAIPTGVLVAPLMPGINDDPRQVERILELAAEAGATSVGGLALHLRGEVRGVFMEWLRSYRPDLVERYQRLYARSAYAPAAERRRLAALASDGSRSSWREIEASGARPRPPGGADVPDSGPPAEPAQAALFDRV